MKKQDVQIGATYLAKVSGKLAKVRIASESRHGGWDAVNVETKRSVRIKSPQRLRRLVQAAAGSGPAAREAGKLKTTEIIGKVYSTKIGGIMYPVRVDRYEDGLCFCTNLRSGLTHLAKRQDLKGSGQSFEDWQAAEERQRAGGATTAAEQKPSDKAQAALKEAAKVTSKVLGVPVGVVQFKAKAGGKAAKTERKLSGLDAAAQVLAHAKTPLTAGEMVQRMLEGKLWKTSGKTPAATIYAAIIREIATKGKDARFRKVARGKFELAK
jgi:hypothetical protein